MRIVLWILQVVLAALFMGHGWLFIAPPAEMAALMDGHVPPAVRTFIGMAEVLGALGLIVPGMTRIVPWLTVLAAAGLMIVVGSATLFHLLRGEIGSAAATAILCALVTCVAYMRWKVKPLPPGRRAKLSRAAL